MLGSTGSSFVLILPLFATASTFNTDTLAPLHTTRAHIYASGWRGGGERGAPLLSENNYSEAILLLRKIHSHFFSFSFLFLQVSKLP
jgi:hypothetical protein